MGDSLRINDLRCKTFNPLKHVYLETGTLANSVDSNAKLQNTAFHQGLHCFPRLWPLDIIYNGPSLLDCIKCYYGKFHLSTKVIGMFILFV